MTERREYVYQSALAEYIQDFIGEKRQLGFIYNGTAYQLKRFDSYWVEHGNAKTIQLEPLQEWLVSFPGESKDGHSNRISAVRLLALYMNSRGISCYVPLLPVGRDHPVVHIFSSIELTEFFKQVDSYVPASINQADFRMANEYPIMFRLYYCCGMRSNEVCSLKTSDVDLNSGIITVMNGKGQKDRLVYLPEDLCTLMKKYFAYITKEVGYAPIYFFPGRNPDSHMEKTNINKRFDAFWYATPSAAVCGKKPTPHCLRHTFVVNRINQWILDGVDTNVMLAYLSKYLGHKSPDETFYYYHLVDDAFRIVRQKDTISKRVIPEAQRR